MSDRLEIDIDEVQSALIDFVGDDEVRAAFGRIVVALMYAQRLAEESAADAATAQQHLALASANACPGGNMWIIRDRNGRADGLMRCEQAARDMRNYRHGTTGEMKLVSVVDGVREIMGIGA